MEISHSQMRQPDPKRCSFFSRMIIRSRFTDHAVPFWLSQDLLSAVVHGMYVIEPWCFLYRLFYFAWSTVCPVHPVFYKMQASAMLGTPQCFTAPYTSFRGNICSTVQRAETVSQRKLKFKKKIDENNLAGVGAGVMGVNRADKYSWLSHLK